PLATSHRRIVWSPNPLPETSVLPSAENATARTPPLWLPNRRSFRPVATSHRRIVGSSPTEARVLPSGEKATDWTRPGCSRERRSAPVVRSHKRTVLSQPPEASVLPSGE